MSRPERMRRVDEAMKKVISEAIPTLSPPHRARFTTGVRACAFRSKVPPRRDSTLENDR